MVKKYRIIGLLRKLVCALTLCLIVFAEPAQAASSFKLVEKSNAQTYAEKQSDVFIIEDDFDIGDATTSGIAGDTGSSTSSYFKYDEDGIAYSSGDTVYGVGVVYFDLASYIKAGHTPVSYVTDTKYGIALYGLTYNKTISFKWSKKAVTSSGEYLDIEMKASDFTFVFSGDVASAKKSNIVAFYNGRATNCIWAGAFSTKGNNKYKFGVSMTMDITYYYAGTSTKYSGTSTMYMADIDQPDWALIYCTYAYWGYPTESQRHGLSIDDYFIAVWGEDDLYSGNGWQESITAISGLKSSSVYVYNDTWLKKNSSGRIYGTKQGDASEYKYTSFFALVDTSGYSISWTGSGCGTRLFQANNSCYPLRIKKTSAGSSITPVANSSQYSVSGAVFAVYKSDKSTKVATLTTTSKGYTPYTLLSAGTYYIKEVTPSIGHLKTSGWTKVVIEAGSGHTTVKIEEDIDTTTPKIKIKKVDSDGNTIKVSGVTFKVVYYYKDSNGDYVKAKTLKYKTDSSGVVKLYDTSYVSSGTPYTNSSGNVVFYAGKIVISEVSAPSGYSLSSDTITIFIKAYTPTSTNGTPGTLYLTSNDISITASGGTIKWENADDKTQNVYFYKYLRSTNSSAGSGYVFSLSGTSSAGKKVSKSATSASNGKVTFKSVPIGTYTLKETSVPSGTKESTSYTVKVTSSGFTITGGDRSVSSGTYYIYNGSYSLKISKKTSTTSASVSGVTFKLVGVSSDYFSSTVKKYSKSYTTGSGGTVTFTGLYPGTYTLTETSVSGSSPSVIRNTSSYTVTVTSHSGIKVGSTSLSGSSGTYTYTFTDVPLQSFTLKKVLTSSSSTTVSGVTYKLVGKSSSSYSSQVKAYSSTKTTGSSGTVTFSSLYPGTYTLTETSVSSSSPSVALGPTTTYTVVVSSSGTKSITIGSTSLASGGTYTVKNPPIQSFKVKKTTTSGTVVSGVTYKLVGVSSTNYSSTVKAYSSTQTTSSSGYVTFSKLYPGTYKLTETSVSSSNPAVILNSSTYTVTVSESGGVTVGSTSVGNGGTYTIKNYERPSFTVSKTTYSSGEAVSGVTFALTGSTTSGTSVSLSGTTGTKGTVTFSDLYPGTYTLKETSVSGSSPSVALNSSTYTVVVSSTGAITIGGTSVSDGGTFKVYDDVYSSFTVCKKTSGGTSVSGVSFKLVGVSSDYYSSYVKSYSATKTTTSSGKVVFEDLLPGTYKLVETSVSGSSPAVMLNSTVHALVVNRNGTITYDGITSTSGTITDVECPDLEITKVLATDSSAAVSGVVFKLVGTSSGLTSYSETATTDDDGIAAFEDLEEGTYELYEYSVSDADPAVVINETRYEVEVLSDGSITVDGEDASDGYTISDLPVKFLTITKYGADGKTVVSGVMFMLYGTTSTPLSDGSYYYKRTQTSDSSGRLTFTDLVPGVYSLVEIDVSDADPAVVLDTTVHDVVVTDIDITIDGTSVMESSTEGEWFVADTTAATLIINKVASHDSSVGIDGVVFSLYGFSLDGDYYSYSGTTIEGGTVTFANLLPGEYTLTETDIEDSDPEIITRDTTKYKVSVDEDGNLFVDGVEITASGTYTYKYTITNVVYRELELHKVTESDEDVQGIVFKLQGISGEADGYSQSQTTGEDGSFTFTGLLPGTYTLFETDSSGSTPAVYANKTTQWTVVVPENGAITITEVDGDGNTVSSSELSGIAYEIENEEKLTTSLSVKKLTYSGDIVKYVSFVLQGTLLDENQAFSAKVTTNENGIATFSDLEAGEYVLTEISVDGASPTVVKSDAIYYVSIDTDANITITDEDGNDVDLDGDGYLEIYNSTYTSLSILKTSENDGDPIQNVTFRLYSADAGYDETQTTDKKGKLTFEKLSPGTYSLTEIDVSESSPAAVLDSTSRTVVVSDDGTVTVDGTVVEEGAYYSITNKTYATLKVVKRDSYNYDTVYGVTYVLSGTSDSGEWYEDTQTTSEKGIATFTSLLPGTYYLIETDVSESVLSEDVGTEDANSPAVTLDDTTRVVVVYDDGTITVDGEQTTSSGRYTVTNETISYDRVTVIKKWVTDNVDQLYDTASYLISEAVELPTIHLKTNTEEKYLTSCIVGDQIVPSSISPGDTFDYPIAVKNTGNVSAYARVFIGYADSAMDSVYSLDINTDDWTYNEDDGYYYYNYVLAAGETTSDLFTTVTVSSDIDEADIVDFDIIIYEETIQSSGYSDAQTAFSEAE